MLDISVIILTYNEEIHIRRCLENAGRFAKDIFIVDSFSTDKTLEIAKEFGAHVYQNKWENNYAKQLNWGLDNCPIKTKWVLRLDADEYLTEELISELNDVMPCITDNYTGVEFPRHHIFLGKEIKFGGNDVVLLRLFQYKKAFCEQKLMDEHMQLITGDCLTLNQYFFDHNLNDLTWWSIKHVGYAIREAIDILDIKYNLIGNALNDQSKILNISAKIKRNMKHKYANMSLFWRSFYYFIYRYFIKGGFRDGKQGFIWCFLQAWWYRTLVDSIIFEIEKQTQGNSRLILEYIKSHYKISLT